MAESEWQICVDTGGTFTDCLGRDPTGEWHRCKVLSSGALRGTLTEAAGHRVCVELPVRVSGRLLEGYELRALGGSAGARVRSADGIQLELDRPVEEIGGVGSAVELSAGEEAPVLGARLLTQTTLDAAFPALVFRLATTRGTNALLERKGARVLFLVNEGFEDLFVIDDQRRADLFALEVEPRRVLTHRVVGLPLRRLADGTALHDAAAFEAIESRLRAIDFSEIDAVAVSLIHGFQHPQDEAQVVEILEGLGASFVVQGSALSGQSKFLARSQTAVVDAYIGPIMEQYLDRVQAPLAGANLSVMSSSGGLVARGEYRAKDGLLSGPAGGVIGVAAVARRAGMDKVIAFDMGGTSTDVSRVVGEPELRNEHQVGDARIQAPSLRIETVAAGGGSICSFRDGVYHVGPESAGAFPGPACYGAGGPLTVTDVNLLMGHLEADSFQVPLDRSAADKALEREVEASGEDREAVLAAFWRVANERMGDALRQISVKDGFDPAEFCLVAFGGAGGQHACALAEILNMESVLIPGDAGILSAYGLSKARRELSSVLQVDRLLEDFDPIAAAIGAATQSLVADFCGEDDTVGAAPEVEVTVDARFRGQESVLSLAWEGSQAELDRAFRESYATRFGYYDAASTIEIATVRCRVRAADTSADVESFELLRSGQAASSVISDPYTTVLVGAGWSVHRGELGSWLLKREARTTYSPGESELLQNTLLTQRFYSLVEEMGKQLERTAVSTNVKERLDFSCALVSADGELVTNAPHIPVHLGALGVCVRRVAAVLDMHPGDVAITNHPGFGGSHLPDITLVMPLYHGEVRVGYLVNRAHHAEVGGIAPGSMSPFAKNLEEEGVCFFPQHIVREGASCLAEIEVLLESAPYPSRRVDENLADLRAQLAALMAGRDQFEAMVGDFGLSAVARRMEGMLSGGQGQMARLFEGLGDASFGHQGQLDDGDPLKIKVGVRQGKLKVDFSGTGPVRRDSLNANEAIVRSALLYVLRLWLNQPVALNEGLMRDVELILPESFVAPRFDAEPKACPAVVGGNVEVSQRVVETLIQALGIQAGSQGTMNNLIFGDAARSYYETICGGSAAGDGYDGASAVHVHMTNTAITDVEILERRYPVVLEKFAVNTSSGGAGAYRGGDGIERRIRFTEPMTVSLLMQGRQTGGAGMGGGLDGAPGEQYRIDAMGDAQRIDGMSSSEFAAGETLLVKTPGGGGAFEVQYVKLR